MKQNYEYKTERIHNAFFRYKKEHPEKLADRLKFSWSNLRFHVSVCRRQASPTSSSMAIITERIWDIGRRS